MGMISDLEPWRYHQQTVAGSASSDRRLHALSCSASPCSCKAQFASLHCIQLFCRPKLEHALQSKTGAGGFTCCPETAEAQVLSRTSLQPAHQEHQAVARTEVPPVCTAQSSRRRSTRHHAYIPRSSKKHCAGIAALWNMTSLNTLLCAICDEFGRNLAKWRSELPFSQEQAIDLALSACKISGLGVPYLLW